MNISAVSFVYNEERHMDECLSQLSPYVDEILIVDMNSTDKTAEIAYRHTKEIYKMPHLICGDSYKEFICNRARGDWLLWFYPDERFSKEFLEKMHSLADSQNYDAYAIMRHEYRDGVRLMPHGTLESPNYQNRFHKKGQGIFYTDLVHAELHGRYRSSCAPPELYMEHWKTDIEQEHDNWRTYVELKHLLWKYRDTDIEPFKTYCDSYRRIISESEAKNADRSRHVHPAEELWWEWWIHKDKDRIPLDVFKGKIYA